MKKYGIVIAFFEIMLFCLPAAFVHSAPIDIDGQTVEWTVIMKQGGDAFDDPNDDQQTGGTEADFVSTSTVNSFYTQFDDNGTPEDLTDGSIAFRTRHGGDSNAAGFKQAMFVGIDGDLDGAIDLFIGLDNSGAGDHLGIWFPGDGANTGPSTTSIVSPETVYYSVTETNYSWDLVSNIDPGFSVTDADFDGEEDYFLSFCIPFNDIVTKLAEVGVSGFNETSAIQYVYATSAQDNALNQDLGGIYGDTDSTWTFAALGALSEEILSTGEAPPDEPEPEPPGQPVPEPGTCVLMLIFLAGFYGVSHHKKKA